MIRVYLDARAQLLDGRTPAPYVDVPLEQLLPLLDHPCREELAAHRSTLHDAGIGYFPIVSEATPAAVARYLRERRAARIAHVDWVRTTTGLTGFATWLPLVLPCLGLVLGIVYTFSDSKRSTVGAHMILVGVVSTILHAVAWSLTQC